MTTLCTTCTTQIKSPLSTLLREGCIQVVQVVQISSFSALSSGVAGKRTATNGDNAGDSEVVNG